MNTSPEKIHFYIRININNISYENSTFLISYLFFRLFSYFL